MALKQAVPDARHVLFFDSFPAGYLLLPLTPCTDTLWHASLGTFPKLDRTRAVRAFKSRRCEPDVAFVMHRVPHRTGVFDRLQYQEGDALYAFISNGQRYDRWKKGSDYSIYLRKPYPAGE
jgi:hypothetical protein